jgi:hypothetical protein
LAGFDITELPNVFGADLTPDFGGQVRRPGWAKPFMLLILFL